MAMRIESTVTHLPKRLGRFSGVDVQIAPSSISQAPSTTSSGSAATPPAEPTYLIRPWLPVTGVSQPKKVFLEVQSFKPKPANYLQDEFMLEPTKGIDTMRISQPLEISMKETPRGWVLPKTLPTEAMKALSVSTQGAASKTIGYRFKVIDQNHQTHTLLDGGSFATKHPFRSNQLSGLPTEQQQYSLVTPHDAARLAQPSSWFQRNTMVDVFQGNLLGRRVAYALTRLRREATPENAAIAHALEKTLLPSQRAMPLMYDFDMPEAYPEGSSITQADKAKEKAPLPLMKIDKYLTTRRIHTLWQKHIIHEIAMPYRAGDVLVRPFIGNDTLSNHGYWASDLFAFSPQVGNQEFFKHVSRLMLSHQLSLVSDFAFVGKGLQSTESMANMYWREMSPFWDWFRYDKPFEGTHAPFKLPAHGHSKTTTLGLLPAWTDPQTKAQYPDAKRIAFKLVNSPYLNAQDKNPQYNPHAFSFLELYDPTKETPDGFMKLHHTPDEPPVHRRRIPVHPETLQQVLQRYEEHYPHTIELHQTKRLASKTPVLQLPDTLRGLPNQAPEVQQWMNQTSTWGHLQLGLPSQDDSGFKWDGQIPNLLPNIENPDVKHHIQSAFDFHLRTLANDQTQWIADALATHRLGQVSWHTPEDVLATLKQLSRKERQPDPMQDGSWKQGKPLPPLPESEEAQHALASHILQQYQALTAHQVQGIKPAEKVSHELAQRLFHEYPLEALPFKDEEGSPLLFKASLMYPILKRNCESLLGLGYATDILEKVPFLGKRVSFDGALKHFFKQTLQSDVLTPEQKALLSQPMAQSMLMSQIGEALYLKLLTGLDRQQLYYHADGTLRDPAQADTLIRQGLEQTLHQENKAWMLTASPTQNAEILPGFLIQRLNHPNIQKDLQTLIKQAMPEMTPEMLLQAKALSQGQRPVIKARLDAAKDFGAMNTIMETDDIPIDGTSVRKSHQVWKEMGEKMAGVWQEFLGTPASATTGNPKGFYGFFPHSEVIAEFTNEGWLSEPLTGVMHKMGGLWTGFVNYALRNRLTRMVGEQNEAHKEPFSELGKGLQGLQKQLHTLSQYYPTSASLQGNQNFTSHHDWTLTMDELIKPGGLMVMDGQKYRTTTHALADMARVLGGHSASAESFNPKLVQQVWMNRTFAQYPDTVQHAMKQALHELAQGNAKNLSKFSDQSELTHLALTAPRLNAHLVTPEQKVERLKALFDIKKGLMPIEGVSPELAKTLEWVESEFLRDHLTHPTGVHPVPFPETLLSTNTLEQALAAYDETLSHTLQTQLSTEQRQRYTARVALLGHLAYQLTRPSSTVAATAVWNNALDEVLSAPALQTKLSERFHVSSQVLQEALPQMIGRMLVRASEAEGERFGMLPIEAQLTALTESLPSLRTSVALSTSEKALLDAGQKHPEGMKTLSRMLYDTAYVPALDKLPRIQALQVAYPGKPSLHVADLMAKTGTETYANRWVQNRPTLVVPELDPKYLAQFTHVEAGSPLIHTRTSPVALRAYTHYQDDLKALTALREDPRFEAFNRGGFPPTRSLADGSQEPLMQHQETQSILPIYRPTSPEGTTPSVMMLINAGQPSKPYPSWDNRVGENPQGLFAQSELQMPVVAEGTPLPLTGWNLKEGTTFEVYRPVVHEERPSQDPKRVTWETTDTVTVRDSALTLPAFSKYLVLREKRPS
ncbi:MAG: hypothetical protein ACKO37_02450 [Vampirovibrionales bacterium]